MKKNIDKITPINEGDYEEGNYLYADKILFHVKSKREILDGKYTYYTGKIPWINVIYDGTYYAHCKNIRSGIKDLEYKHALERGWEQYANYTLDTEIPLDEMITMFRVITGACEQGVQLFIKSMGEVKEVYTPREVIALTEEHYGGEVFRKFFEEINEE